MKTTGGWSKLMDSVAARVQAPAGRKWRPGAACASLRGVGPVRLRAALTGAGFRFCSRAWRCGFRFLPFDVGQAVIKLRTSRLDFHLAQGRPIRSGGAEGEYAQI